MLYDEPERPHVHGLRIALMSSLLAACGGGSGPTIAEGPPACDGKYQAGEGVTVDQIFDGDSDGYVNGQIPQCAETFAPEALDCDDDDPQRHPNTPELLCNEVDDDCNPDTPDGIDFDNDTFTSCEDCDDEDPFQNPGALDLCWDNIDNDCDGAVDPGCGPDYNGLYTLEAPVVYSCTNNVVSIDFSQVNVLWIPPNAAFVAVGSGQPGTVNGTIGEDGSFDLVDTRSLASGLCMETYQWTGTFTGTTSFDGTLTASWFGNFCNSCVDQTFPVYAVRDE